MNSNEFSCASHGDSQPFSLAFESSFLPSRLRFRVSRAWDHETGLQFQNCYGDSKLATLGAKAAYGELDC